MTLGLELGLALVGGGVALALAGRWPRFAMVVAVGCAVAVAMVASLAAADDALVIGGTGLQDSGTVRALAAGWSGGLAVLVLLGLTDGSFATAALLGGGGLLGLGAAVIGLAVDDATVGFAALGAGGIAAVALPIAGPWLLGRDDAPHPGLATRALCAVGGASVLAVAIAAWSQSSAGPLGDGSLAGSTPGSLRAVLGLAIVAMAGLVALRAGAIPLHLWAARLVGALSPLTIPAILAWGTAAFVIVATRWGAAALVTPLDDVDRVVILLAALASIVFGGLASMLHDDLEHVLGYAIVQDAGVALLAFTGLRGGSDDAVAAWTIVTAALATAFASWIAAMRWTFGAHRLASLRGWARRSPILGGAFALVLVGWVGLPGMAVFEARVDLAAGAVPGLPGVLIVAVALSPIVALGRVLAAGLGTASPDVAAAPPERVGRTLGSKAAWSRGGAGGWLRVGTALVRTNEGLGVALATLVAAAIGVVLAVVGVGTASG